MPTAEYKKAQGTLKAKGGAGKLIIVAFYAFALVAVPLGCVMQESPKTSTSAAGGYQRYIPGLEGVPVHRNLEIDQENSTYYDTPEGRIMDVYLSGVGKKQIITDFYVQTLTQLGWQQQEDNRFMLDNEQLSFEVSEVEDGSILLLYLSVRPL